MPTETNPTSTVAEAKATFLMATSAEQGHLMRVLDLTAGLRRRGHRVLVHAPEAARKVVEAADAELVPHDRYRDIVHWMQKASEAMPAWIAGSPLKVPYHLGNFRRIVVDGAIALAEELEPILRREQVDCVVYDFFELGAQYAGERAGIPTVSTSGAAGTIDAHGLPFMWSRSPAGPLLRRAPGVMHAAIDAFLPLRRARAALGLPPRARGGHAEFLQASASPTLHVLTAHRGFLPDVPLRDRQVFQGPIRFDGSRAGEAGGQGFSPPAPGTVLISTTTTGKDAGLLRRVLEAVAPMGVPVLATAASASDVPADLGAHVRIERYVPHERVFPHVAAVVTHGGWGTVGRALRHGVPMLVIPLFGDQHFNAAMVAERGLGHHLPLAKATPDAIRARLRAVLDEASFRARARAVAEELAALRETDVAARALEDLALEHARLRGKRA